MTVTTLNPSDKAAGATLSNGNLTITTASAAFAGARSTTSKTTGKVYLELSIDAVGGSSAFSWGIANAGASLTNVVGFVAGSNNSVGYYPLGGNFYFSGNNNAKSLGTVSASTYVGVALDLTNKNVFFVGPSGTWDGVGGDDPATNTGGMNGSSFYGPTTGFGTTMTTTLFGSAIYAMAVVYNNAQLTTNFGTTAFHYSVPTGFSAWDTAAPAVSTRHNLIFG